MLTTEEQIEKFRELVTLQNDLLSMCQDFLSSQPFSTSEVIPGYYDYLDKISELRLQLK